MTNDKRRWLFRGLRQKIRNKFTLYSPHMDKENIKYRIVFDIFAPSLRMNNNVFYVHIYTSIWWWCELAGAVLVYIYIIG